MCDSPSEEVRRYFTHSPLRSVKLVEDVLRNLNLSSTITPQMINLGLSQERKWSSCLMEGGVT